MAKARPHSSKGAPTNSSSPTDVSEEPLPFTIDDVVQFIRRSTRHTRGSSVTVGALGRVTRVIGATDISDPGPGESCHVEVEFIDVYGGRTRKWFIASELLKR